MLRVHGWVRWGHFREVLRYHAIVLMFLRSKRLPDHNQVSETPAGGRDVLTSELYTKRKAHKRNEGAPESDRRRVKNIPQLAALGSALILFLACGSLE